MYNNTGRSIKIFAEIFAGIGIFLSLLVAFLLFLFADKCGPGTERIIFAVAALVLAVLGSFGFWFSYILLAGYGELIEETTRSSNELQEIRNLLADMQVNSNQGAPVRQDPSDH